MVKAREVAVAGLLLACAMPAFAGEKQAAAIGPELAELGVAVRVVPTPYVSPETVMTALKGVLVSTGFRVVEDGRDEPLLLKVTVSGKAQSGLLSSVVVNGEKKQSYDVTLNIEAVGVRDARVVDQVTQEFTSRWAPASPAARQIPKDEVEKAVARLRDNGRLQAYAVAFKEKERERARKEEEARQERERRAEAERKAEEQRKAEEARRIQQADEAAWTASNAEACRMPRSLDACDGVRNYLTQFAAGLHADTAKQYIKDAQGPLAILADELDWKAAGPEKCKVPASSADCGRVEAYVAKNPAGAHAGEGAKLLKASSAKIASLKKAEQTRAEAADAIEQLCQTLQSLDQVGQAEKMQRRIDAESGTVNLYQKRQYATARVYLKDQAQKLQSQIVAGKLKFNRKRDCRAAE